MADRPGGKSRRSRRRAAGSRLVAGSTGTSGDALLSPMGHTERCTGAYSYRQDGFTALAVGGKLVQANIAPLAGRALWAPWEATLNAKSIAGYLAIALVIWWVIEAPASAAHVVHNIGTFLSSAASGITQFFASI